MTFTARERKEEKKSNIQKAFFLQEENAGTNSCKPDLNEMRKNPELSCN